MLEKFIPSNTYLTNTHIWIGRVHIYFSQCQNASKTSKNMFKRPKCHHFFYTLNVEINIKWFYLWPDMRLCKTNSLVYNSIHYFETKFVDQFTNMCKKNWIWPYGPLGVEGLRGWVYLHHQMHSKIDFVKLVIFKLRYKNKK